MKNKISSWLGLAATLLLVLYWWMGRGDKEPAAAPTESVADHFSAEERQSPPVRVETHGTEAKPPPAQVVKTSPGTLQKVQEAAKQKGARRLQPGMVEFELLGDNIAVAHGDIVLGKLESKIKGKRGQFKPPRSKLWPSAVIPYAINDDVEDRTSVAHAIEYFNEMTPISFVPYTGQKNALVFVGWEERCASHLGRVGGRQPIFLGPECGFKEVLHEVMHALGFVHEQSRRDRDKYLTVNWENILDGFANQFDIVPDAYVHSYTGNVFNFDYNSIMLYPPQSFAKKQGLLTLESKTNQAVEPSVNELSAVDLERLTYLYGE